MSAMFTWAKCLHFGSSALICKIQTSENFLSLFVTFFCQPCLVSSLPWFPTSWVAWVRCSSHRLRWRHSMVSVDAGLETQPEVELVEKAEDKKQGRTPKSSEPDSEMTEAEIMDNYVKDQEEEDWAHGRSSKMEFLWGGLPSVMEPRHLAHEGDQIRTFYDGSWGGANSDIQANCEVPMSDPTFGRVQWQPLMKETRVLGPCRDPHHLWWFLGWSQRRPTADKPRRQNFDGVSSRITIETGHPRTTSGCCWRPTWPRPIWGSKYCRQSGSTR